jgi:NhaA family Na+:H+ antiporter
MPLRIFVSSVAGAASLFRFNRRGQEATSAPMAFRLLQRLLRHEAAAGMILILAAGLAIIEANSPLAPLYDRLLEARIAVSAGGIGIDKPLLLWINDGLMAVFFLMVGLEIKREVLGGDLSEPRRALLPLAAALGGMAVPALFYAASAFRQPGALAGWAIPCATDIAFSLGVMALLGRRVPLSLKLFLTALAIIDDLGSIVIIAIFYTGGLSWMSLTAAALALAVLLALNLAGVERILWYVLAGLALWVFVLKSGVHATLAGVALALAIPATPGPDGHSALSRIEHRLAPWVGFGILPLFGFANAGLSFAGLSMSSLLSPVPLGIIAGLFLGKQIGVFGGAALVVRFGWAELPAGVTWRQLYGASVLTGIGFTMSLFIGSLAFAETEYEGAMRLGVLAGSILSALLGVVVLRFGMPALGRSPARRGR